MNTKIFTKNELSEAAAIIRDGGIVAMPTETVYGLAANALNEAAVQKVFEAKGRQSDNPLIVHIANIMDWQPLVTEIPPKAKLLAERFWPGPLTIILKKSAKVPAIVSGGLDTVAVRMPKNKIAFRFIKECGVPIAAPSANISGAPSPTKFSHVLADMNGKVDGIIDGGDCMVGVESTVISLAEETPVILRPGRITPEQISRIIGKVNIHPAVKEALDDSQTAASPGMKYKHYAPKAQLELIKAPAEEFVRFIQEHADNKTAVICYSEEQAALEGFHTFSIGAEADTIMQAKRLFDILREIDEQGFTKAYAPLPASEGVGLAIKNRLLRASGFSVIDLEAPIKAAADEILLTKAPESAPEQAPTASEETAAPAVVDLEEEKTQAPAEKNAPILSALQESQNTEISEEGIPPEEAVFAEFLEEDSAILALSDIRLSQDFNEDFSKEISDRITVIEKTEEDDPGKIFYEAVLSDDGAKPAAYPVDFIEDDFQFDVYDDDIEAQRRKGLFGFLRRKKDLPEEEPEPFIPPRNPIWDPEKPLRRKAGEGTNIVKRGNEDYIYEKIEGIRVVGLTGKTGCGKSYIAKKLAAKTEKSAIVDADALYHTMLENDSMILSLVVAFGNEILIGKKVDRKRLAQIAFASPENLQKLNETVLPQVAEEIINIVKHAKEKGLQTVYLDAPTLIESKLYQICDEVIFVTADAAIRQERVVARDGITLDEVGQRMRFEHEDSFYVRYADRVIRNN